MVDTQSKKLPRPQRRTRTSLILLLISGVLIIGNTFVVQFWDVFGIPFFFVMAVGVELILILFFIRESLRLLRRPLRVLGSVLLSGLMGMLGNTYVIDFKKRWPHFWATMQRRFSLTSPTGLYLTIGLIVSATFLWLFLGVTQDVLLQEKLVSIDQRILHLIPSIRTPLQTAFFRYITFLGNWQSIIFLAVATSLLLIRKKRYITARFFLLLIMVTQILSSVLKYGIGRERPDFSFSLVDESTLSFPSGHALMSTVVFGFITYLMIKGIRSHLRRVFIFLCYVFLVFLVGVSRIYLGAHYLSDVLGSIVLGAFVLSIVITIFEINQRYKIFKRSHVVHPNRDLLIAPLLLAVFSLVLNTTLVPLQFTSTPIHTEKISTLDETAFAKVASYSETLSGAPMAPVGLIFAGTQVEIENMFLKHGWYEAEAPTLTTLIQALIAVVQNKQYITGPVTPAYLNAQPNDLAFQKPSETNTFRERHHIRWWNTHFVLPDGRAVWVATASFDNGIKFVPGLPIPTHSIDPNIDAEREYILETLDMKNPRYIHVVSPHIGRNAAGDEFFTDGKAAVIELFVNRP